MAQHTTETIIYSGQGLVLLSAYAKETETPYFLPVGNVSEIKQSISKSEYKLYESMTGRRGLLYSAEKETACTFDITFWSINQANLALAVHGETADVASGSVTGTTVTAKAKLGYIIALPHIKISSLAVKKGSTTYELGKNYRADLEAGSVYIMTAAEQTAANPTTPIAVDDVLEFTYSYAAQKKLDALTVSQPIRTMRFEGLNTAKSDSPVVLDVFKVSVATLADLALINEDAASFTVTLNALYDETRTSGSKYYSIRSIY